MAKMSIAQLREKELERLVSYKTNNPTDNDFSEARKIMNSFYRLCGLCETNLYLSNDARTCNSTYTAKSEERERVWYERLKKQFQDTYGLSLCYIGYCPSIGVKQYPSGGFAEKISRYFYQ